MALSHSPKINKNNLIMCVDAANEKSYSGSGTTWADLLGNHDGTMSTPDYNSTAPKTMDFVSDNSDVVQFGIGSDWFPLYNFTLEAWVKSSGMGTSQTLGGIFGFTYGIRVHFSTGGVVRWGVDNGTDLATVSSGGNYQDGVWHHIVGTKRNDGTTNNGNLYIDGDLKVSESRTWTGETRWPTNQMHIGRDNNNVGYFLNGSIGLARVYNEELTAAQVLQNFESTRGRFGV
jgi:hypothetical protein